MNDALDAALYALLTPQLRTELEARPRSVVAGTLSEPSPIIRMATRDRHRGADLAYSVIDEVDQEQLDAAAAWHDLDWHPITTDPPTHEPRRVHATPNESDTMTESSTFKPEDVFDHDQQVRALALNTARQIVTAGGTIFGGSKPSEAFDTDDLVDLAEYVRAGSIHLRTYDADGNPLGITGIDPAYEDAKTKRADERREGNYGPYPPFSDGYAVFVNTDVSDEDLRATVKTARRALKKLLQERGECE